MTKKKKFVDKTTICKTSLKKAVGLMFSKRIKNKGLVFVFNKDVKFSLHMLFVFYPIDVLFLDAKKRIVEMKIHCFDRSIMA